MSTALVLLLVSCFFAVSFTGLCPQLAFQTPPGLVLRSRPSALHLSTPMCGPAPKTKVVCAGWVLRARPLQNTLCFATPAAGDGGSFKAGDELAEAKTRLIRAERELDEAKDELRKAQGTEPVDAQRVAEAKLGVAEAKLGVAEAKLGVAEAKLGVAKAEWQTAPESEKAVFHANLLGAQRSLKAAQEVVEVANTAYKKALESTPRGESWHSKKRESQSPLNYESTNGKGFLCLLVVF